MKIAFRYFSLCLLLFSLFLQACTETSAQNQDPNPQQTPSQTQPPDTPKDETSTNTLTELAMFEDAFVNPFQDWSWGAQVTAEQNELRVHITDGWGALRPHAGEPINNVTKVIFKARGSGQNLNVSFDLDGFFTQATPINLGTEMQLYEIPHDRSPIVGVAWQDSTGQGLDPFFIDDIYLLIDSSPIPLPEPSGNAEVILSVDLNNEQGLISEHIYGMNFADPKLAAELDLPINRWGGNSVTRYNWKTSSSNTGNDWYFLNVSHGPNEGVDEKNLPATATFNTFIQNNLKSNTDTLLTTPMIGWIASGRNDNCGFNVNKYGAQDSSEEPWRPHCGNGFKDGQMLYGKSPEDTSIQVDESYTQEWLEYINNRFGNEAVKFVALDNEPMLWNQTHRDVYPEPLSYSGIRDLSYRYAAAIKEVHPTVNILGPVVWGWTSYEFSAADAAAGRDWFLNPPDRNSHGGKPFLAWYLEQMAAYERKNGQRILDYLDIHYYPAQANVALSNDLSLATQKLRLRSTRSLWDATYHDESWIDTKVELIPRMKRMINTEYPNTKLAISEYNWGATGHINGALAQADVLGIMGREGLDMAMFWANPEPNDPVTYAFRMYRNYDGQGSQFGDIRLDASSTDQEKVSVYAAKNSDGKVTIMAINKSLSNIEVKLNGTATLLAKVYQYSANNLDQIEQLDNQSTTDNFVLPKDSIRLFVLN